MPKRPDGMSAYEWRITRLMAEGFSRSQARGHARSRELKVTDNRLLTTDLSKLTAKLDRILESEDGANPFHAKAKINRRMLLSQIQGIPDAAKRADAIELFNASVKDKFRKRGKRAETNRPYDELQRLMMEVQDVDFPDKGPSVIA